MPGPKIFKTFSSKTDASKSGPAPDVSTNFKGGDPQEFTVTSDNAAPTYPDSLKEAWGVVHQELPQAQGVEKLLNSIGGSAIYSSVHDFPTRFRPSSQPIFRSMLTLSGKRILRMLYRFLRDSGLRSTRWPRPRRR